MTETVAAFRARVRAFLETTALRRASDLDGADAAARSSLRPATSGGGDDTSVARARAMQRALFDAGLAGISWPREYGGQGLSAEHARAFMEEAAAYDLQTSPLFIGLGMCAPTLLGFGSEEQKRRHVPAILRGDEVWCQLFSEPGAGSDLASLATRAARDGDEWVVHGHKVWTTGAHFAHFGILLARTDPDVPKHRGLTMFALDLHRPGVTVRPLRQITGESGFNEVLFDGVRLPADRVIGAVGDGWRVALGTLMHERAAIGAGGGGTGQRLRRREHPDLVRRAAELGRTGDASVRQFVAQVYILERIIELIASRIRAAHDAGRSPGAEGSVAKLAAGRAARAAADAAMHLGGASAQAWLRDEPAGDAAAMLALGALVTGIGGGTTEIQRSVIGERVLGLPREPQVDRDVPYRDLLVGTQARPPQ